MMIEEHDDEAVAPDNHFTTRQVNPAVLVKDSHDIGVTDEVKEFGEKIRLNNISEVILNAELAATLLELTEVPFERPLNDVHVAYLQRAMLRGSFMAERVQLCRAKCKENGKSYRINGQHTCWAVYEQPKDTKPLALKVQMYYYTCETVDDIRKLYSTFDRNLTRSMNTVIKTYLLGRPGFEEFGPTLLNRVSSGFSAWRWEDMNQARQFDGEARAAMMLDTYREVTIRVCTYLNAIKPSKDTKHIFRGPVIAAIFETMNKAVTASREFWDGVVQGVGFDTKNDPRLKLRNYLCDHALTAKSKKSSNTEDMYRTCILAWNAWREKRELVALRPSGTVRRPKAK
jgi:hypothetical protein